MDELSPANGVKYFRVPVVLDALDHAAEPNYFGPHQSFKSHRHDVLLHLP
jgi:hypothetical protein